MAFDRPGTDGVEGIAVHAVFVRAEPVEAHGKWLGPAIILLAIMLRVTAALTPGFHHPDAIYQYVEPAHRLLTGEGVVTWEWRVGMRSWLLPALLAFPMALGEALDGWGIAAARLTAAAASLAIVWAAWTIGARASRRHGIAAAFVAATWFEFVHFGAQTLAEPIATAAFLPAAALLTAPRPAARAIGIAGALLMLTVLLRPHYGPAVATIVLVTGWRDRRRWVLPLLIGAAGIAAASAIVDLATGGVPFAWMVENIRQNIVEDRASRYGVAPPLAYIAWLLAMWGWWTIPIVVGLRFGWRHAPAPVAAALVNLILHGLIGHKEHRFVFLTVAILVIVAAIGWAEIARRSDRRWAFAAVLAGWALASLLLATGGRMAAIRDGGRAGSVLFAAIARDPDACGVAVVEGATFADVPGMAGLRRGQRLAIFAQHDPAYRTGGMRGAIAASRPMVDRIVTTPAEARLLPAGYAQAACAPWDGGTLCLYARRGACVPDPASPYAADRAMARLGF